MFHFNIFINIDYYQYYRQCFSSTVSRSDNSTLMHLIALICLPAVIWAVNKKKSDRVNFIKKII